MTVQILTLTVARLTHLWLSVHFQDVAKKVGVLAINQLQQLKTVTGNRAPNGDEAMLGLSPRVHPIRPQMFIVNNPQLSPSCA